MLIIPDSIQEAASDKLDESEAISAAKIAVQNRMVSAQSITFGKVFANKIGEATAVCGLVDVIDDNNSYDGLERFTFVADEVTIEEVDGSDVVAQKWRDLCD